MGELNYPLAFLNNLQAEGRQIISEFEECIVLWEKCKEESSAQTDRDGYQRMIDDARNEILLAEADLAKILSKIETAAPSDPSVAYPIGFGTA